MERQFINACIEGNLENAIRIYQQNPTVKISSDNEYAFRRACGNGHLNVAQWLYHIKPIINISTHDEDAFVSSCMNGHINVAQWLYQIKPTINISIKNNMPFRFACEKGHLDIARWLNHIRPYHYKLKIIDNTISYYSIISKKERKWFQCRELLMGHYNKKDKNNIFIKLPFDIVRQVCKFVI